MKRHNLLWLTICALFISPCWSQQAAPTGMVPVSIVVSVEAKHGKEVPTVYKEDVRVLQGKDRLQVTEWTPLQGGQAGLELFLLVDDTSDSSVSLQLDDLRKFIGAQPSTAAIGVAYMRDGTVDVRQDPTTDHALAAKALRLPISSSGAMSSPYLSITDLIKRWPPSKNRHEIFMVTSGIDALQPGSLDTYLQDAVSHAQRAGVQVYSIFASHAGHRGHSFFQLNWGQSDLSQMGDATGGEAYFQGYQTPVAYAPFLDEFADRLQHQYRLTFLVKAGKKGEFRRIKLETEVPNAELVAQEQVYVPPAR